jgi:hypothetical protein
LLVTCLTYSLNVKMEAVRCFETSASFHRYTWRHNPGDRTLHNHRCKAIPVNRPWRPIGLWDVEAPTFSRQSARRLRWGCQPYALAALYTQEHSWYSFLLEVSRPQDHSAGGRFRSIEKSHDLIRNRTRDIPASSTALLEKPPIVQLLKKLPTFYGPWRFITVFIRPLHWSLFWARSIPPHPIFLRSILILPTHLHLGLPSGLFPSYFPTNIVYAFPFSEIGATCPAHLIFIYLIMLIGYCIILPPFQSNLNTFYGL